MHRSLSIFAVLAAPAAALCAQGPLPLQASLHLQAPFDTSSPVQVAAAETTPALLPAPMVSPSYPAAIAGESSSMLPDAPSYSVSSSVPDEDQTGLAVSVGKANTQVPPKYSGIILPGQTAVPLSAGDKVVFGVRSAFSLSSLLGSTVSAGYSHLVDSAPHYGTNSEAFGKREGVAALRSTIQNLASSSLFAPVFHDDPRYYELGRQHKLVNRAIYAATRVVMTRSDSGKQRINAPLLLGYGVAAGMNNLYYPDRDTGAKQTFTSYAGSLGGAVLSMEVNEFLDDALRIVHIRK